MIESVSSFWLWQFLGRLHPLIVHFPIGLLVAAFVLECLTLGGRRPNLREGIIWILRIGAASAVLAATFGWLLATNDRVAGELVEYHQWLGVTTAVLAVGAVYLLERARKDHAWGDRAWNDGAHNDRARSGEGAVFVAYRSVLTLSVVCLIVAGHLGSTITHGSDYLTSTLPWNQVEQPSDEEMVALLAEFASLQEVSTLRESDLNRLNIHVRQIFAHNCYKCHSSDREESELRLDSEEAVMRGGEGGRIVIPGHADESEIVRRINLPEGHEDAMPDEGDRLSREQIAVIELWINEGAHWADEDFQVFPEAPLELTMPAVPDGPGDNPVDRYVHDYFAEHGIAWPEPADDATFIRRASLDLLGLLPEPEDVEVFLEDGAPDKRDRLVAALLARNQDYAQHWLTFWNDLLRNDYSGTGFITGGREQITEWLYRSLLTNESYESMVRTLINPTDETEGFIKGIEWRGAANASQTTEMQAAQNVSQVLLGLNLKCASCHDSFVSNWTLNEAYGFAQIFADSTLEIYRCDVPTGRTAEASFLFPELGQVDGRLPVEGRLEQLADIMVKPENGRLYRTIVNRLWAQMMGRGIVAPVDEMDNPPWSQELLDWLAADLIRNGYDLKHTLRHIATSRTYGLPSVGLESSDELIAKEFTFEGPLRRRLTAEQFADALSQSVTPVYASVAFDPSDRTVPADWIWYPSRENDRNSLPRPGIYHFRHAFSLPAAQIAAAEMIATADHSYRLYLNGRLVGKGSDWRDVGRYDVGQRLESGPNMIAVAAENEGALPNPAGLLLSLKIRFEDGTEQVVTTFGGRRDAEEDRGEWLVTDAALGEGWQTPDFDDQDWQPARRFGSHADNKYWGRLLAFTHERSEHEVGFVRASLVERDEFLSALGRPNREIVTTTRDDEATLLQALALTNGEFMSKILTRGADGWFEEYGREPGAIVRNLYREAFGRLPTEAEEAAALDALGSQPDRDAVEDLIWAVVLTPEFQLIY